VFWRTNTPRKQLSNCFTFHLTNFLGHFMNKLMLNRNYFLILSLVESHPIIVFIF
jgi:hypothetical protein